MRLITFALQAKRRRIHKRRPEGTARRGIERERTDGKIVRGLFEDVPTHDVG
jgi:hypothetical protein